MCVIDELGISVFLFKFLDWVCVVNGLLYVLFDVDFIDLVVVLGVVIIVLGGVIVCEVYLVMEMLCDSDFVCLFDFVELNFFFDECGCMVNLMVDLVVLLLGCCVFDCLIWSLI